MDNKKDVTFLHIFIWTSFLTIASIVVIAHTLQGQTYSWVGVSAGVASLLSIWGTIRTFELETDKIYPKETVIINYFENGKERRI